MAGVRRYRASCEHAKTIGTSYVKRAEYFLTADSALWTEDYPIESDQGVDVDQRTNELLSMADILGVEQQPDETPADFIARLTVANKQRIARLSD